MSKRILVLPGDGIGPEITAEAVKVLDKLVGEGLDVELDEGLVGGAAYDAVGTPLPDATLEMAKEADAILLGAVGGPKWEPLDISVRPEKGLLGLRAELGLFSNLRPAILYPQLAGASSLRPEIVSGLDIMIVRELTGGIYFGQPRGVRKLDNGERQGFNTLVYAEHEIERIVRSACEIAMKRGKRLCSVDKANVLECTELWREVATRVVEKEYPEIELSHMYVDNAAMQLVKWPKQFDVMVTTNMFGDILSDAAAMLTGSIGMLPSASLNEKRPGHVRTHSRFGAGYCRQRCGQPAGDDPVGCDDVALQPERAGHGRSDRDGGDRRAGSGTADPGYHVRGHDRSELRGHGRCGGGGALSLVCRH